MLDKENKEFAYAFLADRESYHSQKETSAYTIFLVEAGLFAALWTTNTLETLRQILPKPYVLVPVLIIFLWGLFHIFLRWQLRNRRVAALQVATLIRALTDHLAKRPEPDLKVPEVACCPGVILDHFIPVPRASIIGDVTLEQYPEWYRRRFHQVQSEGTGASFGEVFPSYGSIIMLVAALAYVFAK